MVLQPILDGVAIRGSQRILVVACPRQTLPLDLAIGIDQPLLKQPSSSVRQDAIVSLHHVEGLILFHGEARAGGRLPVGAVH